jgi:lipopolysaccharide transport protein LptA
MRRSVVTIFVILLFAISIGFAQDDDFGMFHQEGQPYIIEADNFEDMVVGDDNRLSILTGNVKVVHGDIQLTGDKAWIYHNEKRIIVQNDVKIVDETTEITARRGIYERRENVVTLFGPVTIRDSVQTIRCDRIVYYRDKEEFVATGDVVLVDQENDARLTGSRLVYDRKKKYAELTGSPVLKTFDEDGELLITVFSDKMEFFQEIEKAVATSNVEIMQDEVKATCLVATLYNQREEIILSGNPEVTKEKNYMAADEIHLFMQEDELERVELWGNSNVIYAPPDTAAVQQESIINGEKITMELEEGKIRYIEIEKNAKTIYYPEEDGLLGDKNVATGGKMKLFMENDEISRVIIENNAEGTYRFFEEEK